MELEFNNIDNNASSKPLLVTSLDNSSRSSYTSLSSSNLREFLTSFPRSSSSKEQISLLSTLINANPSIIEKFASYNGLKLLNNTLRNALAESSLDTSLISHILICLNRINITKELLENSQIHLTLQQIKKHLQVTDELTNKAFKLRIKWKAVIDECTSEKEISQDNVTISADFGMNFLTQEPRNPNTTSFRRNKPHNKANHKQFMSNNKTKFNNEWRNNQPSQVLGKRRVNPQEVAEGIFNNKENVNTSRNRKRNVRFFDDSRLCHFKLFDKEEEPSQCSLTPEEKLFFKKPSVSKGILKKSQDKLEERKETIASVGLLGSSLKNFLTPNMSVSNQPRGPFASTSVPSSSYAYIKIADKTQIDYSLPKKLVKSEESTQYNLQSSTSDYLSKIPSVPLYRPTYNSPNKSFSTQQNVSNLKYNPINLNYSSVGVGQNMNGDMFNKNLNNNFSVNSLFFPTAQQKDVFNNQGMYNGSIFNQNMIKI